ncbi:hypothetical protein BJY16_007062 [Actinoplanes octamycinicus]|uniref:Immunity protein Imm1 n=1 Tax=Actinoplanes octamycinicus TaxID=135948 RepID=A0A7W7H471_9ACTN|nr:Imm1 family immunity protein [Actinoplanes octamycinicus]MBB4743603.1 hypothetical protein [Actinoplanes octamycinicus]GIE61028.1 hypothetical protein Aoc01nite_64300 [Actinoplanes octamycinicus]
MVLEVVIGHEHWCGETPSAVLSLVSDLLEGLTSEETGRPMVLGAQSVRPAFAVAHLSWADRCHAGGGTEFASNQLSVAVNRATGYGALIWSVDADLFPGRGGIYDDIWVSDNPEPPAFDTRVLADPDVAEGRWHDPRSTLPLDQVRAALEEFCRTGTGDRPRSVNWVPAYTFTGWRTPTG